MSADCPYCPDEPGVVSGGWGMSPEGYAQFKQRHDAGHPERQEARIRQIIREELAA
jgi:hypothetical protein